MNRLVLLFILLLTAFSSSARHLKGGFFTYRYISSTTSTITYEVTLNVYMECNATGQQIDPDVNFSFFATATGSFVRNENVKKTSEYLLSKGSDEKCISGNQAVCFYKIVTYQLGSVTLAINSGGYTVSYQRCCRIEDINNISGSGQVGNTYSISIPGTAVAANAEKNNSANFLINDTIVVCGASEFTYPFVAVDPDGDVLRYEFCEAWSGATAQQPAPVTASSPPYSIVPYSGGYSAGSPLGNGVTIDPVTGIIKGIAPDLPGEYVVTVCVSEYKGNQLIATSRKELHLQVGNCVPIKASLNPSYITCDGLTLTFQNNAASSDIQNYFWDLGVTSLTNDTSNQAIVTYTYPVAGDYQVKLVVNKGLPCTDSTTTIAKVYPGFFPEFEVSGSCFNKPIQFTDRTTTQYGVVDSWRWDFGKAGTNADTSRLQNPTYVFNAPGQYNTRLIVTNSKGCIDTVTKPVTIIDRPIIQLLTKDTLICNGDAIQIGASGKGVFTWSPAGPDITNENTPMPTVSPTATKKYYVQLDDDGCINWDSVRVRVVDFVTLQARSDTTICTTDKVQLGAVSDGLRFLWTPSNTLDDATKINPIATPTGTTTYTVTARIGHCVATDDVVVRTVPYPQVNAGLDTLICFGTPAQLNGTMVASSFTWTPTTRMVGANTLSPTVTPVNTTTYTLTVRDTLGCPKPVSDQVVVKVLPKIQAYAGADTAVVVGQPLQFKATGGVRYVWHPGTWLNKSDIPDPIGIYDEGVEKITYKVDVFNEANCVDSAFVTVKIFKTTPQVFVPTAFTPNNDGNNDGFRPIAVGISRIEYFRVFNRWGQLVFQTTTNGKGWDGRIGGKDQPSGVFVWLVKGTDYTGKPFFAKGTVTLIR
jgi:gliding motility-associated-like protein